MKNGIYYLYTNDIAAGTDNTVWFSTDDSLWSYSEPLSVQFVGNMPPKSVLITANSPNPFNSSTTISFTLPSHGRANLSIYSITGQKVRELVAEHLTAGNHSVVWDGKDTSGNPVSSGIYFARLSAGARVSTAKMLLMK